VVYVNVGGIHYDEKYYPNPNEFNPENFSKENRAKRNPMAFLSFGQGPRGCIGMRFALLEAKMGLASVLHKYCLLTCEKTVDVIVPDPGQILGTNKEGLWVRAQRRTH
jgi:cytochrome P450 family 6